MNIAFRWIPTFSAIALGLTACGGGDVSLAPAPVTTSPPVIASVSPSSGSVGGGASVTITGTGLTGATSVLFGSNTGTHVNVDSDTQVTVNAPANVAGSFDVQLTTAQGSATKSSAYTYTSLGTIRTIAGMAGTSGSTGDNGPASAARLNTPQGLLTDSDSNVLIADGSNHRIRVIAKNTGTYYGQAMTASYIYTIAGTGVGSSTGDGGAATAATLNSPARMAVDSVGNLFISELAGNRIRMVARNTGTYYGQAMTAGNIYTIAGTGAGSDTGDGGAATAASLNAPTGVAVDSDGNVLIGTVSGRRVRVIAKSTGTYYGVAMTANNIYTILGNGVSAYSGDGGPATSATIGDVRDVSLDKAGNVFIVDGVTHRVRVIARNTGTYYGQAMTANYVYTLAGSGVQGSTGDGGAPTSATLNTPSATTVDNAGNVLISEWAGMRVRAIANVTGTYYGVAMTAGNIYRIAGNGVNAASGDGGLATDAAVSAAVGIAVNSTGDLFVTQQNFHVMREIAP